MRTHPVSLLLALCCLAVCGGAGAQLAPPPPDLSLQAPSAPAGEARAATPAPAAAAPARLEAAPTARSSRPDQRIERVRLEDNGAVVEEVHYGGQAQSNTVSPKAPVPAYEIVPADGVRSRGLSRDALSAAPGQRVWNLLSF
ncbi:MAG: hypothetical protein H7346_20545 [Burkholderiaceae bacterium]|nr:hypothetical protein [Burkholderiaceae bacterium]